MKALTETVALRAFAVFVAVLMDLPFVGADTTLEVDGMTAMRWTFLHSLIHPPGLMLMGLLSASPVACQPPAP